MKFQVTKPALTIDDDAGEDMRQCPVAPVEAATRLIVVPIGTHDFGAIGRSPTKLIVIRFRQRKLSLVSGA
ncbi:hypothetical protein [Rhizobium sp. BK602]|uniref:hypothetical protein n=1 Tax=Rhizobium sp. BK602 TaxID=2586986 RepID=UPI00160879CE|nr:hypothetical protein [Rhizobium sp. BK602]MBB3608112.1 hypothetical protein [Rhizobium sp. BK602]